MAFQKTGKDSKAGSLGIVPNPSPSSPPLTPAQPGTAEQPKRTIDPSILPGKLPAHRPDPKGPPAAARAW